MLARVSVHRRPSCVAVPEMAAEGESAWSPRVRVTSRMAAARPTCGPSQHLPKKDIVSASWGSRLRHL